VGSTADQALTISDLASEGGRRPDTIRYYERAGLLPAPPRTSGDHRRYDHTAIDRLHFMGKQQSTGS